MSMDLAWTALQWPGLEHVIVSSEPAGFRADSQVILASAAGPVRLSYLLECDASWQVRELTVKVTGAGLDRSLVLSADGAGHWLDAARRPRPDLDTCVDIDISCTPLTNTLPIRRLSQAPGAVHDIRVAYISVPELDVRPARQRYTLLERLAGGDEAVYRYESDSFRADLRVDGEGFVIDYPGLWARVRPDDGQAW